uniref:Uncharacterized protein n=1 Tax=Photinus pyralis TaxID=7054 RepID=A0A1Y1LHL3_PHOPY
MENINDVIFDDELFEVLQADIARSQQDRIQQRRREERERFVQTLKNAQSDLVNELENLTAISFEEKLSKLHDLINVPLNGSTLLRITENCITNVGLSKFSNKEDCVDINIPDSCESKLIKLQSAKVLLDAERMRIIASMERNERCGFRYLKELLLLLRRVTEYLELLEDDEYPTRDYVQYTHYAAMDVCIRIGKYKSEIEEDDEAFNNLLQKYNQFV